MKDRLRFFRNRAGFTRKQLGNRVGLSESAIYHYESGRSLPNIETLVHLANALGIQVQELLKPNFPVEESNIQMDPVSLRESMQETLEEVLSIISYDGFTSSSPILRLNAETYLDRFIVEELNSAQPRPFLHTHIKNRLIWHLAILNKELVLRQKQYEKAVRRGKIDGDCTFELYLEQQYSQNQNLLEV